MTRNAIFQPRKLNFEGKNIVIWNKNNIFAVGNICNHSDQNKINIYMQDAVVNKIKSKIAHGKFGEVYFVSSFPQYDVEYVTKLLAIFEKEGMLNRKVEIWKRLRKQLKLTIKKSQQMALLTSAQGVGQLCP